MKITDVATYSHKYTDYTTDAGTWTLYVSNGNDCNDSD
jgi:hypothetical protein